MKIGLEHIDVYAFNALRLFISAIVLCLIAFRKAENRRFNFSRETLWQIFQYAFLASGIYQVLFLLGIANTTSGNASLIMSTVPMWTALLARLLLDERLCRLAWIGLCIALTGTLIVTGQTGISGNTEYLTGNVIMLLAALAWASSTVKSRKVLTKISPLTLSAISSLVMLPLHFIVAAPGLRHALQSLPDIHVWLPLLYSGIFSTGIALFLWNFGVREAGASHAAVYQNLLPMFAFCSAWIVRGETASVIQLAGGVLIIGGLVVMRKARSGEAAAALAESRLAAKFALDESGALGAKLCHEECQ